MPYLGFSPRAYGFDFYGDNLYTSKLQIAAHPERIAAFRAASLRGGPIRSPIGRRSLI